MNEILIYGPIGADVWEPENSITAKSIMAQLAQVEGDVTVRISSGGGDVYEGIDIMNALKQHDGQVTAVVESMAASAASFIAVGGADRVLMRDSSELMIHRAWTWAEGNATQVAKTLADLERQDNKLAAIYAAKAGGELADWLAAMDAETWYTAQEAVDAGLCDEIIGASTTAPEVARARERFKFANRASAPPPMIPHQKSGEDKNTNKKGDTMSVLNQLADELGKSPEDVQKALSGFFNEAVTISGEVEVTYPADVKIAPTEKVKVEPIVGEGAEAPTGITFTLGDVADGFTAEVDEAGVVSITAPGTAEVGSTADFTVLANEVVIPLSVTVRSLSEDEPEETPDKGAAPAEAPAEGQVTVDASTWSEIRAAAQFGWKAMEADREAKLVAEVDAWIADGRISAGLRDKAVRAIKKNAEVARDVYGSNPKGTIPRAEIGHGRDDFDSNPKAAELRKKNPFPKPRF